VAGRISISREGSADGAWESGATDGGVSGEGVSVLGRVARCFRLAAGLGGVFLDGMVSLLAWLVEEKNPKRRFGGVAVVRGYEENVYTARQNRASGCWCKEKSSTVNRRFWAFVGAQARRGGCPVRSSLAPNQVRDLWAWLQHVQASPDGKQREPFEAQGKQAPALHIVRGVWGRATGS
jgi:hypothetical protein